MPKQAVNAGRPSTSDIKSAQPAELRTWGQRLKNLATRFGADKCGSMAAALSFFMLLSVVPVLLVAIGALALFTGSTYAATQAIEKLVTSMLPGAEAKKAFLQLATQMDLHGYVHHLKHSAPMNLGIGAVALLWAALQIFVNASGSLNSAFEVEEDRSWIQLRLVCLGVMLGSLVLFLLSIVATSGPDLVRRALPSLGIPVPTPWFVDVLFLLLALAFDIAMFAVIYRFLPNAKVAWHDAWIGGSVMGVLWAIATKAMAVFLASPNKMYGALGGVVLLITWMYYTNMLLLLGAEVTAMAGVIRKKSAMPSLEKQRRLELDAVHRGQAVPLSAAPGADPVSDSNARTQVRERATAIKEDVKSIGEKIRDTIHDVKTAPEHNRTGHGPHARSEH